MLYKLEHNLKDNKKISYYDFLYICNNNNCLIEVNEIIDDLYYNFTIKYPYTNTLYSHILSYFGYQDYIISNVALYLFNDFNKVIFYINNSDYDNNIIDEWMYKTKKLINDINKLK